ncbi:MAG: 2-hydroxyhepta-2,4-diene,7-dioate isomerase [Chthonomonadaceae bacterium]|nr:2-hydroxyhepta-2,4-diene,7-dioate isomerase [Chthonomonadaceae bacterium]
MKLYRIAQGPVVEVDGSTYLLADTTWDELISSADLAQTLRQKIAGTALYSEAIPDHALLAPIGSQEVWAAGVTYYRSRNARMEESKQAGGDDFYAKVYEAERPELFFKAPGYRAVGPGTGVRIRKDSKWNVPEPELTLVINPAGWIVGFTIGNDMSSRDIEGENPLYLPQAKVYDKSCALGPVILVSEALLPQETKIELRIERAGQTAFSGETDLSQLKREPQELVDYLYRETSYPFGCYLMTGTGIIPGNDFSLQSGDTVHITIAPIGTLTNIVE